MVGNIYMDGMGIMNFHESTTWSKEFVWTFIIVSVVGILVVLLLSDCYRNDDLERAIKKWEQEKNRNERAKLERMICD